MMDRVNDDMDSLACKRPLPENPTEVRPGPGKVAIMRMRYQMGEHLHHPADAKMDTEDERPSFHSGHWSCGDGVDESAIESDWGSADMGDY